MRHLYALLTGLIFGTGIASSDMMDPAKILNFFDIAGTWDFSMIFVIGGAVVLTFIGYRLVCVGPNPFMDETFKSQPQRALTPTSSVARPCSASVGVFAGFCSGAAIPALGTGRWEVALLLISVTGGFYARRLLRPALERITP